ncbi:MAG: class I SAM-dependent methyltransferase [bacterium]|nr:class I SAM-dependent methyltransferase [bacterium]
MLSLQEEASCYLTHNNTLQNEGYVNMFRTFLAETVTPYLEVPTQKKRKITALDFGSGPGECVLSHLLREEKKFETDIYDVFFSPEKAYEGKTYDLITLTEVMEHLLYPMITLQMLKKHLKPNGILSVMTLFHPICKENPGGEEVFRQWWYRRDPTHISFFRPKTFYYIAGHLNLEILMMGERNRVAFRAEPA